MGTERIMSSQTRTTRTRTLREIELLEYMRVPCVNHSVKDSV